MSRRVSAAEEVPGIGGCERVGEDGCSLDVGWELLRDTRNRQGHVPVRSLDRSAVSLLTCEGIRRSAMTGARWSLEAIGCRGKESVLRVFSNIIFASSVGQRTSNFPLDSHWRA